MGKNIASNKKGGKRPPRRADTITFDPQARSAFLTGFSARKQQRRMFGLAMQKVKDRKARLEQRAARKSAEKEQVEQSEKQREQILEAIVAEHKHQKVKALKQTEEEIDQVQTYQDTETTQHWGGKVIVTTSTHIPDEDEDEELEHNAQQRTKKQNNDEEQAYAGNVEKFLNQLKGNMPAKKRKNSSLKRKGTHGAAKSIGGNTKTAQSILHRTEAKVGKKGRGNTNAGSSGNKRRKR